MSNKNTSVVTEGMLYSLQHDEGWRYTVTLKTEYAHRINEWNRCSMCWHFWIFSHPVRQNEGTVKNLKHSWRPINSPLSKDYFEMKIFQNLTLSCQRLGEIFIYSPNNVLHQKDIQTSETKTTTCLLCRQSIVTLVFLLSCPVSVCWVDIVSPIKYPISTGSKSSGYIPGCLYSISKTTTILVTVWIYFYTKIIKSFIDINLFSPLAEGAKRRSMGL